MELDCSIIPVSANKKPLIKWEEFQKRKASEDEIKGWWAKNPKANVGIVTGSISNLCVVDIDEPKGFEAIKEYIPDSIQCPKASTPRGGRHLYFICPDNKIPSKARFIPGCDVRANGGIITAPPSIGANGNYYKWLAGLDLFTIAPPPIPVSLYNKLLALVFSKDHTPPRPQDTTKTTNDHNFFDYGRRDEDLFHVANTMVKGGAKFEIIEEVLERLIISWGEEVDDSWVAAKIKSALQRTEKRERNITDEVRDWVMTTTGHFLTTESHKELQLTTRNEKKAAIMALGRLVKDGVIEKYGNKHGCFRLIETELETLDYLAAPEKILALQWPFEIEKWVKIMPRNLIVIAGEVNAGKTAYLLNFSALNMLTHEIHYFSSEMGAIELRARLNKFETSLKSWNVKFWERSSAFDAVIRPNAVNIIDFLEIHDEFYKVGLLMKQIYDKLEDGVAIIALQKNPKTDFGLGGMRSIEKARLYLSLENGVIKIVKGKNWACEVNPNGISRTFKLVQGAKFLSTSEWERRPK